MPRPIEEYKARLDKSTASRGGDGVPNVVAIAADSNGMFSRIRSYQYDV
jgi:hypothetical protein